MSISDISAGSLNFTAWTQTTSSASPAASSGAPPVSGHHRHHEGGGGPWMQDVQQVLSKMGLFLPQPTSQTQSAAGADADGDSDGSQASGVLSMREDMLRLMHDLFTALKDSQGSAAGGGTTSSDTTATAKVQSYSSNLTSGLQSLLQQVGSSTSASGTDANSRLQGDFQKLVADLQGQAGSTSISDATLATPTLQTFLQNLLDKLQSQSSASALAVGGVIRTAA